MYLTSSPASVACLSDLSESECEPSRSVSSTITARQSSENIGRRSRAITTFVSSTLEMFPDLTSSPEALPANVPVSSPPSMATVLEKRSGRKWRGSPRKDVPNTSSSSNPLAIPGGNLKLRQIWRALAITHPDFNDRLAIVARLISGGACSLLPTPCASDATRCPGSPNHPRLNRSRGLRLQEELGARPGPEIVEWMMGLPCGYTDLEPSEIPSSLEIRRPSAELSKSVK